VSFVIDNSIALTWCFEDEHNPAVMNLLELIAETGAIAPSLSEPEEPWESSCSEGKSDSGAFHLLAHTA
jgi:hypothetical protein